MKVQPLSDRILVKRLDAVEEKRGGKSGVWLAEK